MLTKRVAWLLQESSSWLLSLVQWEEQQNGILVLGTGGSEVPSVSLWDTWDLVTSRHQGRSLALKAELFKINMKKCSRWIGEQVRKNLFPREQLEHGYRERESCKGRQTLATQRREVINGGSPGGRGRLLSCLLRCYFAWMCLNLLFCRLYLTIWLLLPLYV